MARPQRVLACVLFIALNAIAQPGSRPSSLRLPLRSRVEAFKGSGEWQAVELHQDFPVRETALLICDMWDRHWCSGATGRVATLVKQMTPIIDRARSSGIQIIHAPSDVMDFYKEMPQRRAMVALTKVAPPAPRILLDPPLPVDSSAGGCDTGEQFFKAWTRQHPAIPIAPEDRISDSGAEIYSFLMQRGIKNLLVMGVHTNMCVLNRTFAIKQMTKWGLRCALVRDLTDAMYDPKASPFVSHEQGTQLVIEHIEKYWCPTVTSSELKQTLR